MINKRIVGIISCIEPMHEEFQSVAVDVIESSGKVKEIDILFVGYEEMPESLEGSRIQILGVIEELTSFRTKKKYHKVDECYVLVTVVGAPKSKSMSQAKIKLFLAERKYLLGEVKKEFPEMVDQLLHNIATSLHISLERSNSSILPSEVKEVAKKREEQNEDNRKSLPETKKKHWKDIAHPSKEGITIGSIKIESLKNEHADYAVINQGKVGLPIKVNEWIEGVFEALEETVKGWKTIVARRFVAKNCFKEPKDEIKDATFDKALKTVTVKDILSAMNKGMKEKHEMVARIKEAIFKK